RTRSTSWARVGWAPTRARASSIRGIGSTTSRTCSAPTRRCSPPRPATARRSRSSPSRSARAARWRGCRPWPRRARDTMSARMRYDAVIFDFYGTLAESDGTGLRVTDVVHEHGYAVPDEVARRYWQDGLDGVEHDEHSQSRDHYVAWQRQRLHDLLGECGIDRELAEVIVAKLRAEGAGPSMVAYDDAAEVLGALRTA